MEIWQMNTWELIVAGGPIMAPIILCSLFALTIIIEKLIYLSKIKKDPDSVQARIFDLIKNNDIKGAIIVCEENASPTTNVIAAGLLKLGSSREEIKAAMESASQFEIPKLEQRLTALATIAQVSPLLGLLGTILGMAACFHAIQVRSASMATITPGDLSGGIWEALIATVAGLVIGILTHIGYNYLVSRINGIILEMERSATEMFNYLSQF